MNSAISTYFRDLSESIGSAWNRFWFTRQTSHHLALLRIAVGILAIFWWCGLKRDLGYLFGTGGLLPVEATVEAKAWHFSLLDAIDDPSGLAAFFWGGLAVLITFTVGLLGRVSNLAALVFALSVAQRKALISSPFEIVLPMILLYLLIAPSSEHWSLDAWLRNRSAKKTRPASGYSTTIATRLLQIHLTAMYVLMVTAQLRSNLWWQGSAVWWLSGSSNSSLLNLSGLPDYVTNGLTHLILVFEGAFAVLVWNRTMRPLLLALSIPVWLLLGLLTGEILHSLLMIAAGLAFILPQWLASCRKAVVAN